MREGKHPFCLPICLPVYLPTDLYRPGMRLCGKNHSRASSLHVDFFDSARTATLAVRTVSAMGVVELRRVHKRLADFGQSFGGKGAVKAVAAARMAGNADLVHQQQYGV